MSAVDVVDETFVVVPPRSLAVIFADPRRCSELWPDLRLSVYADRGDEGLRWTVGGALVGTMEVWLEPVLDGTVLHYYLRADPAGGGDGGGGDGTVSPRAAGAERGRRQLAAKRIAFALKDELEADRPIGLPPGLTGVRVHVVSDVHGNTEALARAGDGADALVVLGDLIDFVDYHDHSAGIMGRIFGADAVRRFAELRSSLDGDLRGFVRTLFAQLDEPAAVIEAEVREQYARIFASLTAPTWATPGNVDLPHLWPEFAGDGVTVCDGAVAEIGGRRFGFVGGAVLPEGVQPRRGGAWTPYVRTPAEYRAAVSSLGAGRVDVLASHIPPAVPELCYDVVARRPERGSADLLDFVRRRRPAFALFGHVHSPLARRMRVAATECVNVGHFQRAETPFVLTW